MALTFQIVAGASLALAAWIWLYHIGLASVALLTRRARCRDGGAPCHRFAIVVPAHDEEGTIEATLRCCGEIDYPADKFAVCVIADNCSDRTAEIARQHGARCLVRTDESKRGKGFALEWALPQILDDGYDAVVVLDADCFIDRDALRVFDERLRGGDRVLQANDLVGNPDDSAISYLLALGVLAANELFHAPKSALGLPGMLVGSGMVIHRDVLRRFPWRSRSLCEDTEYSLLLQRHRIPIRFVREVKVVSDFPVTKEQLEVQRRRWIAGGLHSAWFYGVKLMGEGLRKGQWRLIDAGFASVVVSRPLILAQLFLTACLVAPCAYVAPGAASTAMLLGLGGIVVGYFAYAALGVCLLGISRRRFQLLLQAPLMVLRYLVVAARSALNWRAAIWERTPRLPEAAE